MALFDGPDENAHKFRPVGQLTGALESLPQARSQAPCGFCFRRFVASHGPEVTSVGVFGVQRTYESSGASLLIQFTSDETAPPTGEGFEAFYDCV